MTSFEETWNKLHKDHGLAAIVGELNVKEDDLYFKTGRDTFEYISEFADFTGKRVLDYGCGNGRIAKSSVSVCRELVCADASGEILERCSNNVPKASFVKSEMPRNVSKTPSFDICYSMSVIYHLTDIETYVLMDDVRNLLFRGGILIFDYCNLFHKTYEDVLNRKISLQDWKKPWPWVPQNGDSIVRVAELIGYRVLHHDKKDDVQPLLVLQKK
jgi:2-polyprenyl-3-methyl-5-hydroxy-6-metoxy-1,4-benzoquinol methylase